MKTAAAFITVIACLFLNACSESERCSCDGGGTACTDTGVEDAGDQDTGARDSGEPPDAGLDKYFGYKGFETEASGFFRVEKIDGRWWLITPEGHPFFSSGLNLVSARGTPTKSGESHYGDTVKKLYGTDEDWAQAQVERFREWGWNTIGAWSDWGLFKDRVPYSIIMGLGQGNWQSGAIADYFSAKFRQGVRDILASAAAPNRDDPFLIGYFLDNEMHWGTDWRSGNLIENYMTLDYSKDAGKQALISFLKQRYTLVADLNRDFNAEGLPDWDAVAASKKLYARGTGGAAATRAAWTGMVAEQFFYVTGAELKTADPNHLNLGVRFVAYLVPKAALQVAGRYVDVMSINFYELIEGLPESLRDMDPDYLDTRDWLIEHYSIGGRPILISEWSYRAADSGLPNTYPPIYPTVVTQKERAKKFKTYVSALLARDYFVGHHWFIHADQPPEGRFDGENNNFGLVSEQDVPYQLLVEASSSVAREIYKPFWGQHAPNK